MVSAQGKIFWCLWLVLVIVGLVGPGEILAGSCTVTVSPSSVQTNSGTDFSFQLTNTGSGIINYIKITRPSENFTLENHGVSGWSIMANSSSAELTGGIISAGNSFSFTYYGISGSNEASSANWTITTNDGAGEVNCTGSLGTAISGIRDVTAPNITSDITISDITSSVATFSWTTDESSNSTVNYGLIEDEYNLTKSESGMVTSHSITLTGLTANTTYFFEIVSADASGNSVRGSQNEFITAAAGLVPGGPTPTPIIIRTTVTTTTSTSTSTPTPTPRPLVDRVAPVVNILTDLSGVFKEAPTIEGRSSDGGDVNVGVVSVEFSLDGGKNWLPVEEISEVGKKTVTFSFTPVGLEDGNYKVKMRAKDSTGNVGQSKVYTMVIDRLPPQVGGNLFSVGPLVLKPSLSGKIYSLLGVGVKMILSAVGGPIKMETVYDAQRFEMVRSEANGLWSGEVNINKVGDFSLKNQSVDGAKNETERGLNTMVVLPLGVVTDENKKPINKARVKVFVFEKDSNDFVLWQAEPYQQVNPQETDELGEYRLFLPAGKYFLEVEARGKKKARTEIFEVSTVTPVNQSFSLGGASWWDRWWATMVPSAVGNFEGGGGSSLVGKVVPDFSLNDDFGSTSLLGKTSIVTFVSSWEPQSLDQLLALDKLKAENSGVNVIAVVVQESVSKVDVFKKIGGYKIPIVADPDGVLVIPFDIKSLPTHVILDRKGMIKNMEVGFLNESELLGRVLN